MNLFCEAKAKQAAEKNRQILEHCVLDKISLYFTNLYLNIYINFFKKKHKDIHPLFGRYSDSL